MTQRGYKQDPKQLLDFRRSTAPKIVDVLNKNVKLVKEQMMRVEYEMFADENWNHDQKRGELRSTLTTHLIKLGTLAKGLGEMYMKVQKSAKENADMMTFDEKLDACCDFLVGLGRNQRLHALKKLYPAMHKIESGIDLKSRYGAGLKKHVAAEIEEITKATAERAQTGSDPADNTD